MRTAIRFVLALLLVLACAPWSASRSDAGRLADDGRAGDVLALQGTALVRPADRLRWTPLSRRDLVLPGDVIRTAPRGAHALELRFGTASLLLGPGTSIQVKGPTSVHLRQGVLEVQADKERPVLVTGGGDFQQSVTGTLWAQSDARKATALSEKPAWLKSYRDSTSNEWMGALVANVDGRDVPLAVGSHSVVAEIRDQIARTTIEQAFVNTTGSTLEGVFYFPLPAGASISGFGMWIGDELVEADIVERQRARQIYEDILRRKKDPGLLEWEGGNLFKARVFPIFPHSSKRIRIRYTQVLPLEGRTFRYTHALRSELLRSKPLRDLNLVVRVDASAGIEQVGSPTHDVEVQKTDTTAQVRFTAQEFTPENDFELTVRLKQPAPLALLPHRRGEDGYFLLQLSPPGTQTGGWQRDLVPEGEPLDIVVVADTSGSMDEAARANQARFLGALGHVLGEKDRVRLLAYDVEPLWIAKDPVPAHSDAWQDALAALGTRRSLGWSDVDKAFAAAAAATPQNGFVLYLGDGVATTGDADPQALADRLRNAHPGLTVHAVAPSSSYEAPVLQALASLGGGTMREIGSHPAKTAAALLGEALRPLVRDLQVQIEGLRTARVYPDVLPNLPVGMQQSVLGRFLPADKPQDATVVVKGMLDGRPVTYRTQVTVPATDGGNSFLPRLWGRKHIDALLEQGRSKETQAEIVEFSERFGIMTPYTSFLVLESDEDRERYGVERRVRMRDGERFFAQARDKVALEARRDAVRQAAGWRTRQRHEVLRDLARLGRNLPIAYPYTTYAINQGLAVGDVSGFGGGAGGSYRMPGGAIDPSLNEDKFGSRFEALGDARSAGFDTGLVDAEELGADAAGMPAPSAAAPVSKRARGKASPADDGPLNETEGIEDFDVELDKSEERVRQSARERLSGFGFTNFGRRGRLYQPAGSGVYSVASRRNRMPWPRPPQPWTLQHLGFPALPAPFEVPERDEAEDPWPEEERKLLRSLERRDDVAAEGRGLYLHRIDKGRHGQRQLVQYATDFEAWIGATQWRTRHAHTGAGERSEAWVANDHRGSLHTARLLARRRPAKKLDHEAWSLPLWDLSPLSMLDRWADMGFVPKITKREEGRIHVELRKPAPDAPYYVLVVDPTLRVILETRLVKANGDRIHAWRRSGHVLVGTRHYPTKIDYVNAKGDVTLESALTWQALDEAALTKALAPVATLPNDVLVVEGTLPKEVDAKQAFHEGRAGFVEHLARTLAHAGRSQWDDALDAWSQARAVAPSDRVGLRWMHLALIQPARRGEEVKTFARTMLPAVNAAKGLNAVFLARHLTSHVRRVLGSHERLALHEQVRAAWQTEAESYDPAIAGQRRFEWMRQHAGYLDGVHRNDEARATRQQLANENPYHLQDQLAFARDLWQHGDYDPAMGHIEMLLAEREPWSDAECHSLYAALTDWLWQRRLLERLHETTGAWTERMPENQEALSRRISSLLFLGRETEADTWIQNELAARPTADASKTDQARLRAAVELGLGRGWHFSVRTLAPAEAGRLHDLALHLSRLDGIRGAWAGDLMSRIRGEWGFKRTDAARRLDVARRADFLAPGAIESMDAHRMERYIHNLDWDVNAAVTQQWRSAVDRLKARWKGTESDAAAHQLAAYVLAMLDNHKEGDEAIAFVRARLQRSTKEQQPGVRNDLVERLLARKTGGQAVEDELAKLAAATLTADDVVNNRRGRAAEFARLFADRFHTWRYEAALGPEQDRDGWTRAERKQRNKDARTKARRELVARLSALHEGAPDVWKPWLALERIGYGLQLGDDVATHAAAARAVLDLDWKRDNDPLDRLRRERAAVALAYACARKNAPASLRDEVVARFREGLKAEPEPKDDESKPLLDWHHQLWRLLIALDRADALRETLRAWVVPAQVESRWRIQLGYLEAELGEVGAAIEQFEAARSVDELDNPGLQFLAKLHLVQGDDGARNAALEAALARESDWRLNRTLRRAINRLSRRGSGVADELTPEDLRVARVLLRKASWPGNYLMQVGQLYRTTKDHRVLEAIAGGLPGHTKEALYRYLNRVESLTKGIHEEATCDALVARLDQLLATTESTVDRRGIRLAIARIESRAAQVEEADPAHGARALAALRAARLEGYVAGEPRLLANYFARLGPINDRAFSQEVRGQAQALFDREPRGSKDRIAIGISVAKIDWTYGDHEAALARLHALIREARAADGRIPRRDAEVLDLYVNWLTGSKRYRVAEQELLTELGAWKHAARRHQLREQLYRVYTGAVVHGGATSRGRGRALFDAVAADLEREMHTEPSRAQRMMNIYCGLMTQAHTRRAVPGVATFFDKYAKERFPDLMRRIPLSSSNVAQPVGRALRTIVGARRALAFHLDVAETQPRFLYRMGRDTWTRHWGAFADYRYHAGTLGTLAPRLLKLVIAQLEKNLRAGGSWRGNSFWTRRNKYFWSQREQDFADAAQRVAELEAARPQIVVASARLLYGALERRAEGLDLLRAAYDRGGLTQDGRALLARWYEEQQQFEKGIPIATTLVADVQDNLNFRLLLTRLQFGAKKSADALATLQATETRWRERKHWKYNVAASLGHLAATNGLPEPGVTWLEEALRLRQEARGNRGGQDTRTARWYGWLAEARGRLGNWQGALHAATAALQATPRNNARRHGDAVDAIQRVVEKAPDLKAFDSAYEAEVAKTGVDATVIRRAFAAAYLKRASFDAAIRHLLAARTLDGNDADVHRMLVSTYDRAQRPSDALTALFGSIRLAPHNLAAYEDLAARYDAAGNPREAERARTTLVEPAPNQPDGHRRLAQIRTQSGDHASARTQWEQVVRTEPLNPTGWIGLGDACLRAGDREAARKAFEHVLGRDWETHYGDVKKTAAQRIAAIG